MNYKFETGNTYFNYPFADSGEVNSIFGTSGYTALSKVLDYKKSTDRFTASTFNGTAWQDPFVLLLGKGYIFFNYGALTEATLVGRVDTTEAFSSTITTGNNYIGLPFPIKKTLAQAFGTNPIRQDGFLIYQRTTDRFTKKSCSADGAFDEPAYEISASTGYIYFRYSGEFPWRPRP